MESRSDLLTSNAQHFLGSPERIERFTKLSESPDNWDAAGARSLTRESIAGFNAFCDIVDHMIDEREPALFLTFEGQLEVTVELRGGETCALHFISATRMAVWLSDVSEDAIEIDIQLQPLTAFLGGSERKLAEFRP